MENKENFEKGGLEKIQLRTLVAEYDPFEIPRELAEKAVALVYDKEDKKFTGSYLTSQEHAFCGGSFFLFPIARPFSLAVGGDSVEETNQLRANDGSMSGFRKLHDFQYTKIEDFEDMLKKREERDIKEVQIKLGLVNPSTLLAEPSLKFIFRDGSEELVKNIRLKGVERFVTGLYEAGFINKQEAESCLNSGIIGIEYKPSSDEPNKFSLEPIKKNKEIVAYHKSELGSITPRKHE